MTWLLPAFFTFNIQKTMIMASGPITSWQIDAETVTDFILGGAPKSLQMVTAAMKLKDTYFLEEKLYDPSRQHIKNQRHYFADKVQSKFPVVMYECDSWTVKKAEC